MTQPINNGKAAFSSVPAIDAKAGQYVIARYSRNAVTPIFKHVFQSGFIHPSPFRLRVPH